MKTALLIAFVVSGAALAGDLNPPPGPVAPTMKTLDEIEPRVAINDENTPGNGLATHVITQPGSYYLTRDIDAPDGLIGLFIGASDVTVDLNGFTLSGSGADPDVVGIFGRFVEDITIENGRVERFTGDGIELGAGAVVRDVRSTFNGTNGFELGADGRASGCDASNNGGDGFVTLNGALLEHCRANQNLEYGMLLGDGSSVAACVANGNTDSGVRFLGEGTTTGCTADGNGLQGIESSGALIAGSCHTSGNTRHGVLAGARSNLSNCVASSNQIHGFFAGEGTSFASCAADGNATVGINTGNGSTLNDCRSSNNGGNGVLAPGSQLHLCQSVGNGINGFDLGTGSTAIACRADQNTGHGFNGFDRATLRDCKATVSGDNGFNFRDTCVFERCTAFDAVDRCFQAENSNKFVSCIAELGDSGFSLLDYNTVRDCTATNNRFTGMTVRTACNVISCHVSLNEDSGIFISGIATRVVGNHVVDNNPGATFPNFNDAGIRTLAQAFSAHITDNYCIRNNINFLIESSSATLFRNTSGNGVSGSYSLTFPTNSGAISLDPATAGPLDNYLIN